MDTGASALLHQQALQPLATHDRDDHVHHHDDHDLGPETSVDDGEVQRQQLADLDPAAEPRQEAPTPPAASLLLGQSEPDNVGDSGEDSEDEWNYYKIEPRPKPVESADLTVHTNQSVCPETKQEPQNLSTEDLSDMESRLNPDAAEFVPSPTHSKPSFEDTILAQSPATKKLFMDKDVPSLAEFQDEISQRPGEVSKEDALEDDEFLSPLRSKLHNGDIPDLKQLPELETSEKTELKLAEQNLTEFPTSTSLDVSEVLSTKAEYGDDSTTSFTNTASDLFQKNLGTNVVNINNSITETDFATSEVSGNKQVEDFLGMESTGFADFKKGLDNSFLPDFSQLDAKAPISFEVQKEMAPKMEESPERVKLNDDLINPFGLEQSIAEAPVEEYNIDTEISVECQKLNTLNESFEHNPNFTLDAYEISSPLNPCAPSFDYQRLEDETEVIKVDEISSETAKAPASNNLSEQQPAVLVNTDSLGEEVSSELQQVSADLIIQSLEPTKTDSPVLPLSPEPTRVTSPDKISESLLRGLTNEPEEVSSVTKPEDESLNIGPVSPNHLDQKESSLEICTELCKSETPIDMSEGPVDDTSETNATASPFREILSEVDQVETEESKFEELASSPSPIGGDAVHSVENFSPSLREIVTENTSLPDLSDVPAALRICTFPLPPQSTEASSDVEILSTSYTGSKDREEVEPIEKEDNGYLVTDLKLDDLSGEQKDMVETLLDISVTQDTLQKETEENDNINNVEEKDYKLPVNQTIEAVMETEHFKEILQEVAQVTKPEKIEQFNKEESKAPVENYITPNQELIENKVYDESVSQPGMTEPSEEGNLKVVDTDETNKSALGHIDVTPIVETEKPLPSDTPTPPPTPASTTAHDILSLKEPPLEEVKSEHTPSVTVTATAVAAVASAAVAVSTVASKKDVVTKKPLSSLKDAKKATPPKDLDKAKPLTKLGTRNLSATTKVAAKTSPTSPVKPLTSFTQRTSTPKKPASSTSNMSPANAPKATSKVAATSVSKLSPRPSSTTVPKLSTVGAKPLPAAKATPPVAAARTAPKPAPTTCRPSQTPRPATAKPRPATATTKQYLTNGEAKPAEAKTSTTTSNITASRTVPRPRTAPPRTITATKPATTVNNVKGSNQARTGLTNGVPGKPKTITGTTGPAKTAANNTQAADKQVKETANKHISARRVGTVPTKTAPAKIGAKKAATNTAKTHKSPSAATTGSPVIETGAGDGKKVDQLL